MTTARWTVHATRTRAYGAAALIAAAGVLWLAKALSILVTGVQPAIIYELAQFLLAAGLLAYSRRMATNHQMAPKRVPLRFAAGASLLAVAGGIGVAIGALGGWTSSGAESFVVPWSIFYLSLALGGQLALLLIAVSVLGAGSGPNMRWIPLAAALAPLPAIATGLLHVELPVLVIAASWLVFAAWILRSGRSQPS